MVLLEHSVRGRPGLLAYPSIKKKGWLYLEECLFYSRISDKSILPHILDQRRVCIATACPSHVDIK